MHEMSIANSIVQIALDTMQANGGTTIGMITLELGLMAGVEKEALHFCFDAVTEGTAAEGAELVIEMVPISGTCIDCDRSFTVEQMQFTCPYCESSLIQLFTGKELRVVSIDME